MPQAMLANRVPVLVYRVYYVQRTESTEYCVHTEDYDASGCKPVANWSDSQTGQTQDP